jgi:hypothetical protein
MTSAAVSATWVDVALALRLAALVVAGWAVVDVVRRPRWQFSPGRKVLWAATLLGGWMLGVWPLTLATSIVYLAVLRRHLPARALPAEGLSPASSPMPGSDPAEPARPAAPLAPAGWYPDPGGPGERWWDGVGWSPHVR